MKRAAGRPQDLVDLEQLGDAVEQPGDAVEQLDERVEAVDQQQEGSP